MVILPRAGGVTVRVITDQNVVSPVFSFDSVDEAARFAGGIASHIDALRAEADAPTRHGRLQRVEPRPSGRAVIVNFYYHTADAQGMNMTVRATERAAQWILAQ